MSQLSKVLYSTEDGHGGARLMFECPGCECMHEVVIRSGPHPCWTWNGNAEKPTFTPSILVTGVQPITDEQHAVWKRGERLPEPRPLRCHSFVTDGRIQFLGDCTHDLAGETVDLPDFDS